MQYNGTVEYCAMYRLLLFIRENKTSFITNVEILAFLLSYFL